MSTTVSKRATLLNRPLAEVDPDIARILAMELARQQEGLELIASENFTSRAVLEAMGSVLTNKYAEGYPGKRYYGGCVNVDEGESLVISRAKALFSPGNPDAIHVNAQPHSGSQANAAVYMACLRPGDTLLGMSLSHGGPHLTLSSGGGPGESGLAFSGSLMNLCREGRAVWELRTRRPAVPSMKSPTGSIASAPHSPVSLAVFHSTSTWSAMTSRCCFTRGRGESPP